MCEGHLPVGVGKRLCRLGGFVESCTRVKVGIFPICNKNILTTDLCSVRFGLASLCLRFDAACVAPGAVEAAAAA